ncbi:hypothetical protein C8034_v003025 [Colletotrichum sidae]|uniref:WSC domain-containing protein n=1 Tax=Colletotrichum sidae TaxID=1347389 RepID=A0A4R8TC10_9PEZI|nr:hypothetical protein C8034_v003025 [Colletotrichum sidae]
MRPLTIASVAALLGLVPFCDSLTVTASNNANVLANALFSGPGITVSSASYSGASAASGTFTAGLGGIGSGALLTSGSAVGALPGGNLYVGNGAAGSATYCGANSFDAAILTVTFSLGAGYSGIQVEFVLASEEAGGSPDPISIFLNGQQYARDASGTQLSVVSPYLLDSTFSITPPNSVSSYAGSSPPLLLVIPASPGPQTMVFAICDLSDREWDSGLFLKAGGCTNCSPSLVVNYVTTTTTLAAGASPFTSTTKASGTVSGTLDYDDGDDDIIEYAFVDVWHYERFLYRLVDHDIDYQHDVDIQHEFVNHRVFQHVYVKRVYIFVNFGVFINFDVFIHDVVFNSHKHFDKSHVVFQHNFDLINIHFHFHNRAIQHNVRVNNVPVSGSHLTGTVLNIFDTASLVIVELVYSSAPSSSVRELKFHNTDATQPNTDLDVLHQHSEHDFDVETNNAHELQSIIQDAAIELFHDGSVDRAHIHRQPVVHRLVVDIHPRIAAHVDHLDKLLDPTTLALPSTSTAEAASSPVEEVSASTPASTLPVVPSSPISSPIEPSTQLSTSQSTASEPAASESAISESATFESATPTASADPSSSSLATTPEPAPSPTTTTSSSPSPSSTDDVVPSNLPLIGAYAYLGCLTSQSNFPTFNLIGEDPDMTTARCVSLGGGLSFVGIFDRSCYGASSLDDTGEVAEAQCNLECPADPGLFCGGIRQTPAARKRGLSRHLGRRAVPVDRLLTVYALVDPGPGSTTTTTTTAITIGTTTAAATPGLPSSVGSDPSATSTSAGPGVVTSPSPASSGALSSPPSSVLSPAPIPSSNTIPIANPTNPSAPPNPTSTLSNLQTLTTTVLYTIVDPLNPSRLTVTEFCATLPYAPCPRCQHGGPPTVNMETITASCRACGPHGETHVTLTVPAAAIAAPTHEPSSAQEPPDVAGHLQDDSQPTRPHGEQIPGHETHGSRPDGTSPSLPNVNSPDVNSNLDIGGHTYTQAVNPLSGSRAAPTPLPAAPNPNEEDIYNTQPPYEAAPSAGPDGGGGHPFSTQNAAAVPSGSAGADPSTDGPLASPDSNRGPHGSSILPTNEPAKDSASGAISASSGTSISPAPSTAAASMSVRNALRPAWCSVLFALGLAMVVA